MRWIAVLATGLCLALAAVAEARSGPCRPGTRGPACHLWTGHVAFIADGDTIAVDIGGDGSRRPARIRITGINAMEQHVYSRDPRKRRGECHAVQATTRLAQLLRQGGRTVRLAARRPSSHSGHRLRRSVAVRIGGHWQDVGAVLVREGLALWLPNAVEWPWNRRYSILAQQAAAAHAGIWNPRSCGAGPSPGAPLRLWVNWDADGNDRGNVDGEWVKVKNRDGAHAVALGGWWIRDSDLRRYTFPRWARIPPGGTITFHVGRGRSHGTVFHWNRRAPVFENVTRDRRALGDGAYLFDPRGNLRAWMMYPCRVACRDPYRGALRLTAHPAHRHESITVTNIGGGPVDLEGYRLEAWPRGHAFRPGTVLAPGETLRVHIGGRTRGDTRLNRHWPVDHTPILANGGGVVRIASYADVVIACDAWGRDHC